MKHRVKTMENVKMWIKKRLNVTALKPGQAKPAKKKVNFYIKCRV